MQCNKHSSEMSPIVEWGRHSESRLSGKPEPRNIKQQLKFVGKQVIWYTGSLAHQVTTYPTQYTSALAYTRAHKWIWVSGWVGRHPEARHIRYIENLHFMMFRAERSEDGRTSRVWMLVVQHLAPHDTIWCPPNRPPNVSIGETFNLRKLPTHFKFNDT